MLAYFECSHILPKSSHILLFIQNHLTNYLFYLTFLLPLSSLKHRPFNVLICFIKHYERLCVRAVLYKNSTGLLLELQQQYLKRDSYYIHIYGICRLQSDLQPFIHSFAHRRRCQPSRATASSSGAVRVRCLPQGHLDTQLGGAGGSNQQPSGYQTTHSTYRATAAQSSSSCAE